MRLAALLVLLAARASAAPLDLDVTDFTLPNGLRVILSIDRSAPTVGVALYHDAGSRCEAPGQTGFAHLLEHLAFQGSKNLGPRELADRIDEVGGETNAVTTPDYTALFEEVPAPALERTLWMESDRMRSLVIDEPRLAAARARVRAEQLVASPLAGAEQRLNELAFASFGYRHPIMGSPADVSQATPASVQAFYSARYPASGSVLALAGDFDAKQARALVERYFGDLEKRPPPPAVPVDEPAAPPARSEKLAAPGATSPSVALAYRIPPARSPDWYALDLLGAAWASGESSQLGHRLIDELMIARSVEAGVDLDFLRGPGLLRLVAVAEPGHDAAELAKTIDAELARVVAQGIDDRQLKKAKARVRMEFLAGIATHLGRAQRLAEYALLWADPRKLRDELERYAAVTVADVGRVAKKYLAPSNRVSLDVEPAPPAAPIAATPAKTPATRPPTEPKPTAAPPPLGPPTQLVFPKVSTTRLSNGLEVQVVERHGLPLVELVLAIGAGSSADEKAGTATLLAGLLHEGTKSRTRSQLADELELAGGDLESVVDLDATLVQTRALPEQLATALGLLADAALHPALNPPTVDLAKLTALDQLAAAEGDVTHLAAAESRGLLFSGSSYGRSPTRATLTAIERADVERLHADRYRPSEARLIVVGDVKTAQIVAAARAAFGTWSAGKPPPKMRDHMLGGLAPDPPPAPSPRKIHLVARADLGDAIVHLQLAAPRRADPDFLPLLVGEQVLAQRLRKHRATALLEPGRLASSLTVEARTTRDRAAPLTSALLGELERLGRDPATADEIESARRRLVALLGRALEDPTGIAHLLSLTRSHDLPADYWPTFGPKLSSVTPEAVRDASSRQLVPGKAVIVVVGANELKKPLATLGEVVE